MSEFTSVCEGCGRRQFIRRDPNGQIVRVDNKLYRVGGRRLCQDCCNKLKENWNRAVEEPLKT